jgi:ABC-type multidrug transport system ATPase subunit
MMMATAPSASHMISHVPLNTTEGRIRSLLKEYAPQELDPEVFEYLSSLLSSGEREPNHNDMVDMISQFFGQGHEHEAKELVDRVSELTLKENKNEIVPRNTKLFPLGTTTTMPVELAHRKTEETTSTSDGSSARSTNKEQEHRQKRETQRESRRKQRKADQQNDNVFVDDDISAWAERKAEGKTWGGRGFGGRGVRGDVNTPSNIHLTNVTLSFAGNELLQNSTIQINGGHRYGLIGRNGVGKTTLLRRLASKAIPGMPQNMRIVLVEQAAEGGKQSALQALMDSDEERHALLEKQAHLEEQFDKHMSGESLEEIAEQLEEVAVELDAVDADRSEERAKEILGALQFTDNMMQTQTENLSGGWRMRLALAQALFLPSDLLLLDEPTNFLDLHALVWLSDYLVHSEHTLIVVSHDRVFLDMCTDIISMEHKKLVYHVGNYSAYEQQQEEKASREAQILDASERQRAKAISFIQKQEASANKKRQDPKKQRQAKMVKEKKLERIGNYRE